MAENWLDLTQEQTLDPERPICDPHHHLWDHPGHRYLLHELQQDLKSGHNIESTVFVECMSMYRNSGDALHRPVGETEFVQGIGAMSASGNYGRTRVAAGIVGYADLTAGAAIEPVLEAHIAASPNAFRGIRHAAGYDAHDDVANSHTNPPEGLYFRDDFRQGLALLEKHNLNFDAWHYHTQIADFTELVGAFPNITFILDHFGGPLGIGPYEGRQAAIYEAWQAHIEALSRHPNVYAKLGGIYMKVNGFGWHKRPKPPTSTELADASAHYYHHTIKCFGAERCMFESNFPVDKASCSYNVVWNTFKRIAGDYSPTEQDALFRGTAMKAYRIEAI